MSLLDHACIGDIEGCRTILNTGFDINYVFDFEDANILHCIQRLAMVTSSVFDFI